MVTPEMQGCVKLHHQIMEKHKKCDLIKIRVNNIEDVANGGNCLHIWSFQSNQSSYFCRMASQRPKEIFQLVIDQLSKLIESNEATALAEIVLHKIYDIDRTGLVLNQPLTPREDQLNAVDHVIKRLIEHEPIQYLFNEADFYGRTYYVDHHVLIPRQETELLIHILRNDFKWKDPKMIDIGTGSGCIACSLSLEIEDATVTGFDISEGALTVATKNAKALASTATFHQLDILKQEIPMKELDLVVSNPPYVMEEERTDMKANVLEHEPDLALFVSDEDPLLFYREIATKGKSALKKNGLLFFEINEQFGLEVENLLLETGYSQTKIYEDLHGKARFVSGFRQ